MALIVGNITGAGIFGLPTSLAFYGPITLACMALTAVSPLAVLASAAMIINYLSSNGATVFTTLVLVTGITATIPYAFSAPAQMKWHRIDHRKLQTPRK